MSSNTQEEPVTHPTDTVYINPNDTSPIKDDDISDDETPDQGEAPQGPH